MLSRVVVYYCRTYYKAVRVEKVGSSQTRSFLPGSLSESQFVVVVYNCSTYYKAVRVGEGG